MKKLFINNVYVGELEYKEADQPHFKGDFHPNKNWSNFSDKFFCKDKFTHLYEINPLEFNVRIERYWNELDELLIEVDCNGIRKILNYTMFVVSSDNTFCHRLPLSSSIYCAYVGIISRKSSLNERFKYLRLFFKLKSIHKKYLQRRKQYA
ncbi:hypothetical protein TDB9533_04808 [Thalassocella blandensis]|nr:hypothetical protein TDB9533_04808 [Thalassocella blandensis]